MQKHKKITVPVFWLRVALLFFLVCVANIHSATAQMQQPTGSPKKNGYYSAPYWDGFKLKHADKCEEALKKLIPIAHQGYGFEEAQLATGLCMLRLAGLTSSTPAHKKTQDLMKDVKFKQGFQWILRAANAGHFRAQATMVSLYADDLAPADNPDVKSTDQSIDKTHDSYVEGAMWAHLYLTNPLRLQIGAPIIEEKKLKKLENNMTKNQWLLGKELARNWIPVYNKQ